MSLNGGRQRRRMPKPRETTFAEHVQAQQEVLAQERVVRNLRAAVRAMGTERPFTPADRSRGLFHASSSGDYKKLSRTGSAESAQHNFNPRPPSSFTIGRKQFLASLPDTDELDRPTTGVRLVGRPARTIAKSARISSAEVTRRRCMSGSLPEEKRTSTSRRRLPSGSNDQLLDPELPEAKHSTQRRVMPPTPISLPERMSASSLGAKAIFQQEMDVSSDVPRAERMASDTNSQGAQKGDAIAKYRRSTSADQLTLNSSTTQLLELVSEITQMISEKPMHDGQKNSEILRSLYRLTDLSDPRLLARVGRLILAITRKGTVKNVCKMVFKLSRDEANDIILHEEGIPDVLIGILDVCNRQDHIEGLVYCCGAIKNLSNSAKSQRLFVERGTFSKMNKHLADIIDNVPSPGTQMSSFTGHLLVQLTAALRNLVVEAAHIQAFEDSGLVKNLCSLLETFAGDKELILNIMRIFSKVTAISREHAGVSLIPRAAAMLLNLAIRHGARKALCVRIFYVLGNLTAESQECRQELFDASNSGQALFDCLERRGRELVNILVADAGGGTGSGDDDQSELNFYPSTENHQKTSDLEDLVIKVTQQQLVRVIANLCISQELGIQLALDNRISTLLEICSTDVISSGHHDLLLNVVGCVNNISFYNLDENFVLLHRLDFSKALAPYLLSQDMDLVVEHTNREVVYTVCGVLMNLLSDPEYRHVMLKNELAGVDNLIEVVSASNGDWQLAGLACKTLWNYAEQLGQADSQDIMLKEQMEDLLNVLQSMTENKPSNPDERLLFEEEFFDVASHLRRHIFDGLHPLEPL
eukprot:gene6987-7624_t